MDTPLDHGPQPLSARMAEKSLSSADLVRASPGPITHKMVSRAKKGRQLTPKTIGKVVLAYNAASGETATARELFNYLPPRLKDRQ